MSGHALTFDTTLRLRPSASTPCCSSPRLPIAVTVDARTGELRSVKRIYGLGSSAPAGSRTLGPDLLDPDGDAAAGPGITYAQRLDLEAESAAFLEVVRGESKEDRDGGAAYEAEVKEQLYGRSA